MKISYRKLSAFKYSACLGDTKLLQTLAIIFLLYMVFNESYPEEY